ncbi:MAG: tRNA (adenosine(37)-N6)-threonylcarbamoyltransferase complex dimerization subunit type 1 TsaB [Candidatus Omnitrophica bacterium]|nr:tRNA (adenosine(37)-N6)-threonylcarbamoyltransferase complex dimerization subunit type 1 TsaB [Candidatus Omnitrophota bacterium]MBI2174509.1 tRNA (adenosine(37)-N6)-threonylcarbamoyltransferase complex dimerization subunit type 1 TsaB [Candidatus Omnitrophota bacterium]MBI3010531.1 tRNA (adenosine(37)-N6)-threonylcarbamoyltransferase complex dimerization subunit type 1 TsaB [Candidatus Omnitrophota bacterium]
MKSENLFLAIETATRQFGVAAFNGNEVLSSVELLANYPHAAELPGAVERVLKETKTELKDLKAVIVDIGPGSFTGLRIGLAFAKALVFPHKLPLIGISSLDVLAAGLPARGDFVCPLLDAKQKNIYGACYKIEEGKPVRQGDYFLGKIEEFLSGLKQDAIFLGDGSQLYREQILSVFPKARWALPEFFYPRSATLARLGVERFHSGQRDDPATLVPLYLYPLDCSIRGPDRPTAVLKPT